VRYRKHDGMFYVGHTEHAVWKASNETSPHILVDVLSQLQAFRNAQLKNRCEFSFGHGRTLTGCRVRRQLAAWRLTPPHGSEHRERAHVS
jgi:hypothetical protein